MTKPVRLTIKGAGDAGDNAPTVDDLLGQVADFVEILKGVEKALGDDHGNQIVWRVTDAERQNPITFELTPTPIRAGIIIDDRAINVERIARAGFAALRNGDARPPFFTDEIMTKARQMHARVRNGLVDTIIDSPDASEPIVIDTVAAGGAERTFAAQKAAAPKPYRELGSIEGFVSKAELDGFSRAVLRFWARTNGAEIKAVATGEAFKQLEEMRLSDVWHGVRVRVYGTISYKSLGIIDSMTATGIEVLDRSHLPGIDEIVDPNFTGGLSVEEFLAEQRRD
ncbi:hypothetical protein [Novosphingobium sp. Gsoil 351]|uniref:hypothetical protein n=1 Tax=Novosphingobium sp. Gsoil 351 TaxID=2675225 RepID=UPI0012B4E2DF|nr:hypothetical protein [Novosphingobium sp. Gsoil 351]QGN54158.1 hypothetical protein GKE62_05980 [Novosphingobium sp. Gsoil 351]